MMQIEPSLKSLSLEILDFSEVTFSEPLCGDCSLVLEATLFLHNPDKTKCEKIVFLNQNLLSGTLLLFLASYLPLLRTLKVKVGARDDLLPFICFPNFPQLRDITIKS